MITYVYKQDFEGSVWTSEPFTTTEQRVVVQGVIGGYIMGKRRWAVEVATGALIYGLDARGKVMAGVPA